MKNSLSVFFVCLLMISPIHVIFSQNNTDGECSKTIFLAYFPEPFVTEVLKEYQVPSADWSRINADLQSQEDNVTAIVESKIAKMSPNLMDTPASKDVSIQVLRETLLEIFSRTMNKYGIEDENQIKAMLDEIQYKKAKRIRECMTKEVQTLDSQGGENEGFGE